jgi:hypothetical protein
MHFSTPHRSRSRVGLFASIGLVLALSACSVPGTGSPGSMESSSTAGASAGTGAGAGLSDSDLSVARDEYDLKLAKCMRGQGLDVKDPAPGMGIQESGLEFNDAALACRGEIGDPPVSSSPPSAQESLEMWLKEVTCFREKGYDVEEPALDQAYTIPDDASPDDVDACLAL